MAEGRARRAIDAARNDIEAGRLWKARDRLDGAIRTSPHDRELLLLLGDVLYRMSDLPRAGAIWLLTERDDEAARAAVAALYERCGRDEALVRRAIPYKPPIEGYPEDVRDRLLALGIEPQPVATAPLPPESGLSRVVGRVVTAAAVALLMGAVWVWVVGLVEAVRSTHDALQGRATIVGVVGAAIFDLVVVALLFAIPFAGAASIRRRRRNRELAFGGGAPDGMAALRTGRLEPSPGECVAWGVVGLVVPSVGALALFCSIDAIRAIRRSEGRLHGLAPALAGAVLGTVGVAECLALVLLLLGFEIAR